MLFACASVACLAENLNITRYAEVLYQGFWFNALPQPLICPEPEATSAAALNIPVKPYLITTGTVFALITLAHVARVFAEGAQLAKDAVFICLTLLAGGLSVWGFSLLRR